MGILDDDLFEQQNESGASREPDYRPSQDYAPRKRRIWPIVVLLVVAIVLSSLIGYWVGQSSGINGDMPLLVEAYELLKQYYIEDISFEEFQLYATAGMLGQVDRFTGVYDLTPLNEERAVYGLSFQQAVVRANPLTYGMFISEVREGTSAASVGANRMFRSDGSVYYNVSDVRMQRGDRIAYMSPTKVTSPNPFFASSQLIDMTNVSVAQLSDYVDTADRYITVYVQAQAEIDGTAETVLYEFIIPKRVAKERAAFYYSPSEIGSTDTAMIRFTEFTEQGLQDYMECLESFVEDPASPSKLILDLRDNGGGNVLVCGAVVGSLLQDSAPKQVMRLNSNAGYGKMEEYYVDSDRDVELGSRETPKMYSLPHMASKVPGFRVAILCNGNSASASEATIGALTHYDNVPLIGTKTFGKGVSQITFTFEFNRTMYEMYITNGYFYVPGYDESGNTVFTRNLHGNGFEPTGDNLIRDTSVRPYDRDPYVVRALQTLA